MPIVVDVPLADHLQQIGAEADARIADLSRQVSELVGEMTITATPGPSTIRLDWTEIPGSVAYALGRDGVDNRGNPPIFMLDAATARSRLFVWMLAQPYTLTVIALPSGIRRQLVVSPLPAS